MDDDLTTVDPGDPGLASGVVVAGLPAGSIGEDGFADLATIPPIDTADAATAWSGDPTS